MSNLPPGGSDPSATSAATGAATGSATGALLSEEQIRWVRRSVVIMTALLIIGIAVLIGRVIYLARAGGTQAASAGGAVHTSPATFVGEAKLALPAGSTMKGMSLSGQLLAVEVADPAAGPAVLVLDLATGKVVSRVSVTREP